MRITNKIMRNNNLANINTNKIYQDKLSTQMSTQKKISRPSEDPVVAIRALRLRSNVTEVTQYYSKNIPDAQSWLEVTEKALDNLTGIITNMIGQCTKGANGDLTSSDRNIIIEQMKALGDEVYTTGDADFAGRYVFTGYRTDTSLSFMKADTLDYEITEQVNKESIDTISVIRTTTKDADGKVVSDLKDINEANYKDMDINETDVSQIEVYRIRLAYSNCGDEVPVLTYKESDGNGNFTDKTMDVTVLHDYEDPYTAAADMQGVGAVYVPETGEMLLSEEAYKALKATEDSAATSAINEDEIRITYHKKDWKEGDLRPEHYFACKSTDEDGNVISYNDSYLESNEKLRQVIEYDVGFNQVIQVNSMADECFKHKIGREVEDLVNAMQDVVDMEAIVLDLEAELEKTGVDTDLVQTRLDAANKALTFMKDKAQRMFEAGITTFQGCLDEANLSITNCGTRSSKLSLVESRMQVQKTTFETLKSENEDADITEVAIQLGSAELTYEAALMATGKIMQTTLLNFI